SWLLLSMANGVGSCGRSRSRVVLLLSSGKTLYLTGKAGRGILPARPESRDSRSLVAQGSFQLHFSVEILRLVHGDFDELDRPALERARRLVLLTHGVAAVVADAQAVAGERELAQLRLHRPLGHGLVVDVELGLAEVLLVRARAFPDELHTEDVLARR